MHSHHLPHAVAPSPINWARRLTGQRRRLNQRESQLTSRLLCSGKRRKTNPTDGSERRVMLRGIPATHREYTRSFLDLVLKFVCNFNGILQMHRIHQIFGKSEKKRRISVTPSARAASTCKRIRYFGGVVSARGALEMTAGRWTETVYTGSYCLFREARELASRKTVTTYFSSCNYCKWLQKNPTGK